MITMTLLYFAVRAEIVHNQSTNVSIGASYRLTCSISGYNKLQQLSITYQWFKNGNFYKEDKTSSTLNFNSLTFDDHGEYACRYFFTPHMQARVVNGTSPPFVLDFDGIYHKSISVRFRWIWNGFHSVFHHNQVWGDNIIQCSTHRGEHQSNPSKN